MLEAQLTLVLAAVQNFCHLLRLAERVQSEVAARALALFRVDQLCALLAQQVIARDRLDVIENRVSALGAPNGVQNRLVIRERNSRHVLLVLVQQLGYHELCELLNRLWRLERAFQKGRFLLHALVQSADEVLKRYLLFDRQRAFQHQGLQILAVFAYFLVHYAWCGFYKCALMYTATYVTRGHSFWVICHSHAQLIVAYLYFSKLSKIMS